jgi:hypothetical protein
MSVALAVGTARRATELLQLLTELPSTPLMVADDVQQLIAAIEEQLPAPHHSQPWDRDHPPTSTILLDLASAEAVVELLELFAAMPSTPPALAADARQQAAAIASVSTG